VEKEEKNDFSFFTLIKKESGTKDVVTLVRVSISLKYLRCSVLRERIKYIFFKAHFQIF